MSSTPSGNQLHDVFKNYIRTYYMDLYVSTICHVIHICDIQLSI